MPYIGKSPTPVPLSASDLNDDIISLAKMAGGTDGNLITYDASGNPAAVATGDDGQVLTSAGAGAAPAFEAAGGGAWTKISNQNASGESEIEFNTLSADYRDFRIVVSGWVHSSSQNFWFRISDVYGYETANYRYSYLGSHESTLIDGGSASAAAIMINHNTPGMSGGESFNGVIDLFDAHDTTNLVTLDFKFFYFRDDDPTQHIIGMGSHINAGNATTGMRFYADAGTIDSGSFTLYGRKIT